MHDPEQDKPEISTGIPRLRRGIPNLPLGEDYRFREARCRTINLL
jgi:hypothetical protein